MNDPGTDSGDDSSSWRHHSRNRHKTEFSPGRVSLNKNTGVVDMPPELIVTSAQGQITVVETVEKQVEVASKETQTTDKKSHKSSRTAGSLASKTCSKSNTRPLTEVPRAKQSSLLRSKIWTGIPCACHEPNITTHWSGRGGEASLLNACSQKLANLRQKREPTERNRKPNKKPLQRQTTARKPRRTSMSDTSAGEENKKCEASERTRKSDRKHVTRCNSNRRMHKDSSNDSSAEDEVGNNLVEVKKLLVQKHKLQKWKTSAHSSTSKSVTETIVKTEVSKSLSSSTTYTRHGKTRTKPSLKWKFCHAVAAMVSTHDDSKVSAEETCNQERTATEERLLPSASESDTDCKPEVPVVRASSANSKKKKKRKSNTGQKKPRRVSSASAVPSTSGKQTGSKKAVKTWQQ